MTDTNKKSELNVLQTALSVLVMRAGGELIIMPEEIEKLYGFSLVIKPGPGTNYTLQLNEIGKGNIIQ